MYKAMGCDDGGHARDKRLLRNLAHRHSRIGNLEVEAVEIRWSGGAIGLNFNSMQG